MYYFRSTKMESEKRHNFLGIYQLPSRKNRTLSTSCLYASYVLFSIKRTPFRGAKLIYMFDLSRIQIPLLYQLSETAIMFVLTLYIIKPSQWEKKELIWTEGSIFLNQWKERFTIILISGVAHMNGYPCSPYVTQDFRYIPFLRFRFTGGSPKWKGHERPIFRGL